MHKLLITLFTLLFITVQAQAITVTTEQQLTDGTYVRLCTFDNGTYGYCSQQDAMNAMRAFNSNNVNLVRKGNYSYTAPVQQQQPVQVPVQQPTYYLQQQPVQQTQQVYYPQQTQPVYYPQQQPVQQPTYYPQQYQQGGIAGAANTLNNAANTLSSVMNSVRAIKNTFDYAY